MDGPDFLTDLMLPAGILAGAIIVALGGWRLWRSFKPRRTAWPPRGQQTEVNQPRHPIQTSNWGVPAAETIWQINNILASIEARYGITPTIMHEPIRLEEKLERIRSRLIAINLKSHHAANSGVETAPVSKEPVVTPSWSSSAIPYGPASPVRTFAEEFVEMYNRARENKEERNLFWSKFQVVQIGNRNASDQRMGRTTETDFRKTDVGDFLAIQNADTGTYLVVPHFTLVIDDTSYRYGGVEAAFECDFTPGVSHQQFQVITPAEFVNDGETWILKNPGKLSFREY